MYARYQAALSQADAAASMDDAAATTRLAAATAAAVVRRPARFAQLPASAGGAAALRARVVGAVVGAACADAARCGLLMLHVLVQHQSVCSHRVLTHAALRAA